MATLWLPTGCVSGSSGPKESPQIYQAPVLRLEKGARVETRDGLYIPQERELWHSDQRFRQLEAELINTAAALAQERARR